MKVTTINGEEVSKKDARRIKREDGTFGYYKIGYPEVQNSGDCYQINNLFYALEKKSIVWDYFLNRYVLKTGTVEGIIDVDLNIGSFSAPDSNFTVIYTEPGLVRYCVSDQLAKTMGYIQGNNKTFYNPRRFSYKQIFPRKRIDSTYKNTLLYNFKGYMATAKREFANYTIVKDDDVEAMFSMAPHLFNNYSFGIELETTQGMIPESVYKSLGVMPVRDGSISGLEYVTIPLQGKKGLYAFKDIMEALIKYTDFDYTCSMHIHVGGVPRTMEFIIAMFKFGYYFQNHLYQMFPGYKRIHDGTKRQCYTGPLDSLLMSELNFKSNTSANIRDDFQRIVYSLSGKHPNFAKFIDIEDIDDHPSDPNQSAKWHMKERYKWLNLIPLIFTNKQTIEYRIFTVPDTVEKAMLFLLLSLSYTEIAVSNTTTILNKPSFAKNLDLQSAMDYANVSSMIRYSVNDRLQHSLSHSNNKGAFYEESDLKLPLRIFNIPRVAKSSTKKTNIVDSLDGESSLDAAIRRTRERVSHLDLGNFRGAPSWNVVVGTTRNEGNI